MDGVDDYPYDSGIRLRLTIDNEQLLRIVIDILMKAGIPMNLAQRIQVETAIDAAIAQLGEVFIVVDALPAVGLPGKIYLVSEGSNFSQWIWHAGAFKRKGSADVSLVGYFHEGNLVPITNQEIDAMLASLV